ncbi:SUMF1/EgtB/PvdO family nonheme iron enzyme [Treponema zioleckii]|uniref:SUMF1/EgtB/PvdO family nonheme iron enzyme n=1 Tax=Treponema zioleckii TaxID=331680 RepID=UPI001F5BD5D7|nr:SUMF1/EgtB/PvdO family nonheme iron enzyme [Treponema zioleckii]
MILLKKISIALVVILSAGVALATAQEARLVQVELPKTVNLSEIEKAWLPNQIQGKIKANAQEYLGMRISVDSGVEATIKKLQRESESAARDEATAIEQGQIESAKFAILTDIIKTGKGYSISVNFTDLTSGSQKSVASKEYAEVEYLYGSAGAVDEITLSLANKLGIELSDLHKSLLTSGSAGFTVDEQMALAKQNEENLQKMMAQYDKELARLNSAVETLKKMQNQYDEDFSATENIKKIEAEKALLAEKQRAEQKRQQELAEQKRCADEDKKLEAERSIALKTQRDLLAKDAAAKAAEVRKLKIAKQGVLGQINIIESKKKALVEIRNSVESRSQELYAQLEKDRASEEKRIRNKKYSTVELENGQPTEAAKTRREKLVIKSYQDLTNKFFADCDAVKASTQAQDSALLAEIRTDQKSLTKTRTVSSMGEELKVSFGTYEGSQNGWRTYLSLYSDGVLLYTDSFIVGYEALSGKKAPDMETELDDNVIEEYTNNVDMYNSLLTRGDPIIYFEIDYTATAEADDKPSEYTFNFNKIRVINTVSGKTVQTTTLSKTQPRTMTPVQNLREITGIVASEKEDFAALEEIIAKGKSLAAAKEERVENLNFMKAVADHFDMVDIPNQNFAMLKTEVTQKLYTAIMGENPSHFKGENNPVEEVSWYDAIYFCNKLSEKCGMTPVYAVDGNTDVSTWGYTPHKGNSIRGSGTQNSAANGFRLPTNDEWVYAAKGGENYEYAGSNNVDDVAWYGSNSGGTTHSVAQKKPNGYGLYDMSGNVREWVWDSNNGRDRCNRGGSWNLDDYGCLVSLRGNSYAYDQYYNLGFRVVRSK